MPTSERNALMDILRSISALWFLFALIQIAGCAFFIPAHPQSNLKNQDALCVYTPAIQKESIGEQLALLTLKYGVEMAVEHVERTLIVENESYTNEVVGIRKGPLYIGRTEENGIVKVAIPFSQVEVFHQISSNSSNASEQDSCIGPRKTPRNEVGAIAVFSIETQEVNKNNETVTLKHRLRLDSIQVSKTKAKVPIVVPWKFWTYLIPGANTPSVDFKYRVTLSTNA